MCFIGSVAQIYIYILYANLDFTLSPCTLFYDKISLAEFSHVFLNSILFSPTFNLIKLFVYNVDKIQRKDSYVDFCIDICCQCTSVQNTVCHINYASRSTSQI